MKKEAWIEVLVGTIILGTLAFLAVKIVDITGTLGSVEAKITSTSDRVERIAQVLPDVGVRIAQEEIKRPIRTVVLASTPTVSPDGQVQTTVTVLDTTSSNKWVISVKLSSKDDRRTLGALAWAGADLDKDYYSFNRLQEYSKVAGEVEALPAYVDIRSSFVLCSVSANDYLKEVSWLGIDPRPTNAAVEVEDWRSLRKVIKAGRF